MANGNGKRKFNDIFNGVRDKVNDYFQGVNLPEFETKVSVDSNTMLFIGVIVLFLASSLTGRKKRRRSRRY